MTYDEAVSEINSLLRFGMMPGLERVEKLLSLMGNPQKQLRFVHVAGTNGKGSTCALISSVLTSAGYRTGQYISPYVLEFRERIQIDGAMIPETELARLTGEILPLARQMAEDGEIITEFEFITAIAFRWFFESGCDVVVLEVGLGGRFDATNVIQSPLVSVIARIDLDHTAILGDTVDKIAFEKCGILKEGCPVAVYPDQYPQAMAVITQIAAERHCPLIVGDPSKITQAETSLSGTSFVYDGLPLKMPLIGAHQFKNASTALAALEILQQKGFDVEKSVQQGFRQVRFPARLELLCEKPAFLLDGAHNPNGTRALAEAVRCCLSGRKTIAVMGMLADKDSLSSIESLEGLFHTVLTLTPDNPRALEAGELARRWREAGQTAEPMENVDSAVEKALDLAGTDGAVVVCGSLYLAAELRPAAIKILRKRGLAPHFD